MPVNNDHQENGNIGFIPPVVNETIQADNNAFIPPVVDETVNTEEIASVPPTSVAPNPTPTTNPNKTTAPVASNIHISDTTSPIVITFGGASTGKTVALVRLIRYLRKIGYTYEIDFTFVSFPKYAEKAAEFNKWVNNQNIIPTGNGINEYLLIKIKDKKLHTVCQFLEAPGEHYFDYDDPNADSVGFPAYMNAINTAANKKIWMYLAVADWERKDAHGNINFVPQEKREQYVRRIQYCKTTLISPNDKHIIVYNQVDKSNVSKAIMGNGILNKEVAKNRMLGEYSGIDDIFPVAGWRKLLGQEGYKFVAFSASTFPVDPTTGKKIFSNYKDDFPKDLWNTILYQIRH